jgi:hypothetical protein
MLSEQNWSSSYIMRGRLGFFVGRIFGSWQSGAMGLAFGGGWCTGPYLEKISCGKKIVCLPIKKLLIYSFF